MQRHREGLNGWGLVVAGKGLKIQSVTHCQEREIPYQCVYNMLRQGCHGLSILNIDDGDFYPILLEAGSIPVGDA